MRAALWLLGLFAVAVAVALFLGNNQSTVTVFWPPYRLDLSLNLVLLGLVALFLILHIALRALSALLSLPGVARRWRIQHQERAMQLGLIDALSHLTAGRYIRARKSAEQVLEHERALARSEHPLPYGHRLRAVAHLLAAESAHALQDRASRDRHAGQAMEGLGAALRRDELDIREGLQLRAARWALDDRDLPQARQRLVDLPLGVARRTLALRLKFKVARLARHTAEALETARLLGKHRAFSESTTRSMVRGLVLELLQAAHDGTQLARTWDQLDSAERELPEVAIQAARRLLAVGGDASLALRWLLPVWEQMVRTEPALSEPWRVSLIETLEQAFTQSTGAPDAAWLSRIEAAQMSRPGDALLQYLAGMVCMRMSLWGKAQQLLRQSLGGQTHDGLKRSTWRALAQLAEQRDDAQAAAHAWKQAAQ